MLGYTHMHAMVNTNAATALLTRCKFLFQAHANRLAQCDDDASLQSCLQDMFNSEAIAAGWYTAACHFLQRSLSLRNNL